MPISPTAIGNPTPNAGSGLAAGCRDIARQLVEMKYGNGLNVAMGGGRANFLPDSVSDPEYPGKTGARKDGRDLTQAWLQRYGERGQYVWNQAQFDKIEPGKVDHLLALFEPSHMNFEHDRRQDAAGEPSLAEMTGKAIDILAKNPEGYLLLVEGGRIDHGSHNGNAYRTLSDAVALNEAVKTIVDRVNLDETLVIVTGDHSHTLTIAGYAKRGNPILGIAVGSTANRCWAATTSLTPLSASPMAPAARSRWPNARH